MTAAETTRVLIIAVGNPNRNDDGAGWLIADRLGKERLPGVAISKTVNLDTGIIDEWEEAGRVVILDAVKTGGTPGTLYRFGADDLPRKFFNGSTHSFGVAETVELARALGKLPGDLLIFGIEGGNFGHGNTISSGIQTNLSEIIRRVREEVLCLSHA